MDRETILAWLEQACFKHGSVDDPPPIYEHVAAITPDNVAVIWYKNDNVIELQSTSKFGDGITGSFFDMGDESRHGVVHGLREKMRSLGIKHNIIISTERRFFGFTLRIYISKTPSRIDLLNAHKKMTKIRDVIGRHTCSIVTEAARTPSRRQEDPEAGASQVSSAGKAGQARGQEIFAGLPHGKILPNTNRNVDRPIRLFAGTKRARQEPIDYWDPMNLSGILSESAAGKDVPEILGDLRDRLR